MSVVALAFSDADRWVLSNVLALEALSLFHVASRIARLANRFIAIPVLAFQPEVTRVDSEGRAAVALQDVHRRCLDTRPPIGLTKCLQGYNGVLRCGLIEVDLNGELMSAESRRRPCDDNVEALVALGRAGDERR